MSNKPAFSGISRGNDKRALDALIQNVELFMGSRGGGLDRAITVRDLVDLNLASIKLNRGNVTGITQPPGSNTTESPFKPVNLQATGTWSNIILTWDANTQASFAYTEIYRSETDNFGNAIKIDQTNASIYADGVGNGKGYYYWLRNVNSAGAKSALNKTAGTYAETAIDINEILDELASEINESHLAQTLRDRIDLLDMPETGLVDRIESLTVDKDLLVEIYSDLNNSFGETGNAALELALKSDELNSKLEQYRFDFESFRDAAFNVDPDNGSIEMIAVDALRTETAASITTLNQRLDAVSGTISLLATKAEQTELETTINEVELNLDAANAAIELKAEKATVNELDSSLNQVSIGLEAAEAAINLKADSFAVSGLDARLSQAEIEINSLENEISLKVSNAQFETLIAVEFSITQTYQVGDEVIYDNQIWRCHTEITTPGNWQSTSKWELKGSISTRFAQAEQRLSANEDNLASLTTTIESLNLDEAVTTLAQVEEILTSYAGLNSSQAELNDSIRSEFYNAGNAQLEQLLALEYANVELTKTKASVTDAQKTFTDETEALAQKNIELEAQLTITGDKLQKAFAGVTQAYQAIARESEARVSQNEILTATLETAKTELEGAISNLSGIYATPDGVRGIVENELNVTYGITDESGNLKVVTNTGLVNTLNSYATQDYAETKAQEAQTAATGSATSSINTLKTTLAGDKNTNGSIAQSISQYTASNPQGGSATLEQLFNVAYSKGVSASESAEEAKEQYTTQWGIKGQVGDLVGGVGFYNDGSKTQFIVSADVFSVIDPRDDTARPLLTVKQNAPGYEDGVYLSNVFIDDLAVEDVIAKTIAADEFIGVTSTAVEITGGSIDIASGKFKVDSSGNVTAKSITIKNAYGDTILSSGVGIPAGAVSGLGSLALKNSIDYNSEVGNKPTLGDLSSKDSLQYHELSGTKPPSDADKTNYSDSRVSNNNITESQVRNHIQNVADATYISQLLTDNLFAGKAWIGQVYAKQLEGDVYNIDSYTFASITGSTSDSTLTTVNVSGLPQGMTYTRKLRVESIRVYVGGTSNGNTSNSNKTSAVRIKVYKNNVLYKTFSTSVTLDPKQDIGYTTLDGTGNAVFSRFYLNIPASTSTTELKFKFDVADSNFNGMPIKFTPASDGVNPYGSHDIEVALFKSEESLN